MTEIIDIDTFIRATYIAYRDAWANGPVRFFLSNFTPLDGELLIMTPPASYEKHGLYVLTSCRYIYRDLEDRVQEVWLRDVVSVDYKRGISKVRQVLKLKDGTVRKEKLGVAPSPKAWEVALQH